MNKHITFYRGHRIVLENDRGRWTADIEGKTVFAYGIGIDGDPLEDYEAYEAACKRIDEEC